MPGYKIVQDDAHIRVSTTPQRFDEQVLVKRIQRRPVAGCASIIAVAVPIMIAKGEIAKRGILSPATDLPSDSFIDRLNKRGININETIEQPT